MIHVLPLGAVLAAYLNGSPLPDVDTPQCGGKVPVTTAASADPVHYGTRWCAPRTWSLTTAMARGRVAANAALTMLGTPYSWGGGGPDGPSHGIGHGRKTVGFDCSGLTEYAWARAGLHIGTTSYTQWRAGPRIRRKEIQPGDLVFFDTKPKRKGPDHVGIATTATDMVVAPFTGAKVRVESIKRKTFMGIVRPAPVLNSEEIQTRT
ncbi:C40 family peptidase [Nonomuraea sediminis]|uniref:C40 family peptidase n=1 Tax=Nonomuraea sediminis TaxID=2835864 RepID=UPI001BDBF663|nr:C40 family peptidase [Nonomuraea sediminis]